MRMQIAAFILVTALALPGRADEPTTLPAKGEGSIAWMLKRARESVGTASDPLLAARLAAVQGRANEPEGFKELTLLVQQEAAQLEPLERAQCWLYLAEGQHRLGFRDEYVRTVANIRSAGPDAYLLINLARLFARVGDEHGLVKVFDPAPTPEIACRMHAAIAGEYLAQGRIDAANHAGARAIHSAASVPTDEQRSFLLSELMDILPELDLRPEALAMAEQIQQPAPRALALVCIGNLYASAGNRWGVRDIVGIVEKLLLQNPPSRLHIHLGMARLHAQIGQRSAAARHADAARIYVRTASSAHRAEDELKIAITLTRLKDYAGARIRARGAHLARLTARSEHAIPTNDAYPDLLLDLALAQAAAGIYDASTRFELLANPKTRLTAITQLATAYAASGNLRGLQSFAGYTHDAAIYAVVHGQIARVMAGSGDWPRFYHWIDITRGPLADAHAFVESANELTPPTRPVNK